LLVADGKHDAVAETVVVSVLLFVMDDLPAFRQGVAGIGLEDLRQRLPAVGGITQSVMTDDFGIQAASVEVLACGRVDLELVAVKIGAGLQGFFQRLLFFLAFGADFRCFHAPFFMRNRHACAVGKVLDGIGETHALLFYQKAYRAAVRAAAEAVVELFARADGKRRRFFFVKRAAGHVVRTAFLQRHAFVYDVYNVSFCQQVVDKVGRNHGRRLRRMREYRVRNSSSAGIVAAI